MNSWASVAINPISERFSLPPLSLYDTSKEKISTIAEQNTYRMYVCGITPYDATHLGHAATYLTFDLINRYLRARGATVKFVQNITDIDDPLLERAARDGVNWKDLAQSQIDLFRSDMVNLHIIPPDHYIGVVEAMPLVVQSISELKAANSVYTVDNDLYFKVHADADFGTRSHYDRATMEKIFSERGGDPLRVGKEDALDALLWLSHRENEPSWPSPFGEGRPGWHIECCAIALHYLQPDPTSAASIDIQGGGSDLIFPHHEMSAAQGAILKGKPFAQHYVHSGMIGLDGEKMSKSKGNLVFVSKLVEQGHDPMAIRWALMRRHYSDNSMWSDEILARAEEEVARLRSSLSRIDCAPTEPTILKVISALSENLNTDQALEALLQWADQTSDGAIGDNPGNLSRTIDALLGLAL